MKTAHNVSQRKLVGICLAGWLAIVVPGGLLAWFYPPAPRFATVDRGVLYRSGQPDGKAVRVMRKRYGIRTIVNLRSADDLRSDILARNEIAAAEEMGITFINLPFNNPSPGVQVKKFLDIMKDRSNYPVLIHCAAGVERSGVMVAAYRVRKNHWTAARAIREMKTFGFVPSKEPEMCNLVRAVDAPQS